jgi:hypothetical protein
MQTEFIEFSIREACFVDKLDVYECFYGALVRILGKARDVTQYTELWSGPSDDSLQINLAMRKLEIKVVPQQQEVAMIDFRFEFRGIKRNYYYHLNGVKVHGVIKPVVTGSSFHHQQIVNAHHPDLRQLPLDEAVPLAQEAFKTEESKLQSLVAQEAAKIEAVRVEYHPLKEAQSVRLEEARAIHMEVQGRLGEFKASIGQKPIHEFTEEDVKCALLIMGVAYDRKVLKENAVNGDMLSALTLESEVREALGVKPLGDCTRVLNMVRSIMAGKGLPRVRDVTLAGMVEEISHWGIEQLASKVCVGPLKDAAGVLREHKIAGDVIEHIVDLGYFLQSVSLTLPQRLALKKELLALRAKMTHSSEPFLLPM